jgi:predicted dehydrogenase
MPISISLLGVSHPHLAAALAVIATEPDVRLAAAWDNDRAGIPGAIAMHAVADLDVAIRRADAVVVLAPTDQRAGICLRAARSGRPVLVEPPIAPRAAESRAAARELARTRTPVHAAMFLRELPVLGRLRAVLSSGMLGRIAGASASLMLTRAVDGTLEGRASWLADPRRGGVGAFGELAAHLLDALHALGAPARIEAVSVDRSARSGVDLGGAALGSWAGAPLDLRAGWIGRPPGLALAIDGTRASALVRDGTLVLLSGRGDGHGERWAGAPPDPAEGVRAFIERLRRGRLSLDGLSAAVRAQEALERAARVS